MRYPKRKQLWVNPEFINTGEFDFYLDSENWSRSYFIIREHPDFPFVLIEVVESGGE